MARDTLKAKGGLALAMAACLLAALLAGCTSALVDAPPPGAGSPEPSDGLATSASGDALAPDGAQGLRAIHNLGYPGMGCDKGFFSVDIPGVTTYQLLLFYDYETLEQRVLCDVPGCAHDSKECPAYIDSFGGVYPFAYGDALYLNYVSYNDGTPDRNQWPAAIEKRNLDGSNPQVMVTYPHGALQPNLVFTDGQWLYYIEPGNTLVRLHTETFEKQDIWQVPEMTTRADDELGSVPESYTTLLECTYGGKFLWQRLNPDGSTSLLSMHPETGELTTVYSWPVQDDPYFFVPYRFTAEGKGYYTNRETGEIRCIDIATGEDTLVSDAFKAENIPYTRSYTLPGFPENGTGAETEPRTITQTLYPAESWQFWGPYEDWLIISRIPKPDENGAGDYAVTALNLFTGEMGPDIPFRDFSNASVKPLMIWGNTPKGLLVTEETRPRTIHDVGMGGEPVTVESEYPMYALIEIEDFVAGRPEFKTIRPTVFEPGG